MSLTDLAEVYAPDQAAWRTWLRENHTSSPGVWLVYYKKESGEPSVTWDEAVEEALCYGWIDSKVNRVDERRYKQVFTPRKAGSVWSKVNKERLERLIAAGKMTPAGQIKIDQAKADGSWTFLDSVENLEVPDDLMNALRERDPALENFSAFPDGSKKQILLWIKTAKKGETRAKHIRDVVRSAARGERAR